MPYYRTKYENCYLGYTNYHTLNFFTASIYPTENISNAPITLPTGSCLIYPNHVKDDTIPPYVYSPKSGPFTVDFYINPRYTTDNDTQEFKAGTILHISSTLAVSLLSASNKDEFGRPDRFKILLQLSHSADIKPSTIKYPGDFPRDLIFSSSDSVNESLKRNHWHHVTIRWGGTETNNQSGSIKIDSFETDFHIPSSSFHTSGSDCVFVGNYFDSKSIDQAKFFNSSAEENEGVTDWNDGAFSQDPVTTYTFQHPLNAEIHDLKIYDRYLYNDEVYNIGVSGPPNTNNLLFYVPPWFVKETRRRDVLVTPFQKIANARTDDPFNAAFAMGVGGKLINLENYTREMVKGEYPRLFHLTASIINYTVEDITSEQYVYSSGSILKRNFTILPNDNGLFMPDYSLLVSGTVNDAMSKFISPLGNLDISMISIEEIISTGSLYPGLIFQSGSIFDDIAGSTPANPRYAILKPEGPELGIPEGSVLTIFQRTRDPSIRLILTV